MNNFVAHGSESLLASSCVVFASETTHVLTDHTSASDCRDHVANHSNQFEAGLLFATQTQVDLNQLLTNFGQACDAKVFGSQQIILRFTHQFADRRQP